MIEENPVLPYFEWLLQFRANQWGALWQFLLTVGILLVVGAIVALIVAAIVLGPAKGAERVYRMFANAARELFHISPHRVFALARLAGQEALRGGRVLIVVALFLLLLLFAGWFLQPEREPAKLLISLVLGATSYLGLLIALILAVFSLPDDFKNKTIYTVVTKPVRASDMILGRIVGFTAVGTALLLIMGVSSYIFVVRSLDHTHTVELVNGELPEFTSMDMRHRHEVLVSEEGEIFTSADLDHTHSIVEQDGRYVVSSPESMIRARVPKRGEISFLSRQGTPQDRGISVGKEWSYQSFIEGGTQAAAIWEFDGIDESILQDFGEEGKFLPVELSVRVFRTYKGDIETPIQGTIQLRKPGTNLKSSPAFFYAKDATLDAHYFPQKLTSNDPPHDTLDLLDDMVVDGKIEVVVQCLNPGQYFGFGRADCYIRLEDGSPLWNFVKAYLSIWVQMVLVIAIAVMASTILSGPIALLFTAGFIVLGLYRDTFMRIAFDQQEGGGPVESLVRIVTGMNMVSDFRETTTAIHLMRIVDNILQRIMQAIGNVIPDFSKFSVTNYIADGFDIPNSLVAQQLTIGLAYVIGLSILGYFLLRNREVAR